MGASGPGFFRKPHAKTDHKVDAQAATELCEIKSSVVIGPLQITVEQFYQPFRQIIIQYLLAEKDDVLSRYKSEHFLLTRNHAIKEILSANPYTVKGEIDLDEGAFRALKAHYRMLGIVKESPNSAVTCLNKFISYLSEGFRETDRRTLFTNLCDTLGSLLKIERIPECSIFDRHDKQRNEYILKEAAVIIGKQVALGAQNPQANESARPKSNSAP